jgi:hypothetical protein
LLTGQQKSNQKKNKINKNQIKTKINQIKNQMACKTNYQNSNNYLLTGQQKSNQQKSNQKYNQANIILLTSQICDVKLNRCKS